LQQGVRAGAHLRMRRRGPVTEGEEADFFHGWCEAGSANFDL
jgi:hypothetical protein